MNKFYRWCYDITLYVFKVARDGERTKNTKHRGVATEVLEGSMTPLPSFVFYKEMESDRSQKLCY